MPLLDFISTVHKSTARDYLGRVVADDKAECAEVALKWGKDYWDGNRKHGYGGMRYDGRWRPVAEAMAKHYQLSDGAKILDVGCGKGYLLYELAQVVPGAEITGLEISEYAIENAKEEVRPFIQHGSATELPFTNNSFDLVFSINTLHNLYSYDLWAALGEIVRVARGNKYITVESYRNEREKMNLLYWQLTCRAFLATSEWEWLFDKTGYDGDYSFIFFE